MSIPLYFLSFFLFALFTTILRATVVPQLSCYFPKAFSVLTVSICRYVSLLLVGRLPGAFFLLSFNVYGLYCLLFLGLYCCSISCYILLGLALLAFWTVMLTRLWFFFFARCFVLQNAILGVRVGVQWVSFLLWLSFMGLWIMGYYAWES